MKNLCCKCAQDECPRCFERSIERREWIGNLVKGVLMLWTVARIAYIIGEVNGRNENSNKEEKDSTDEKS